LVVLGVIVVLIRKLTQHRPDLLVSQIHQGKYQGMYVHFSVRFCWLLLLPLFLKTK
jgi:hypothetical protein